MKLLGLIGRSLFLVLLFVLVGTAVILAWSIGIGWLLTLFLPFSWFEAAMLVLVASAAIGALGVKIIATIPPESTVYPDDFVIEPPIPTERFYSDTDAVTMEAWFRFEMANEIHWEFTDVPSIEQSMSETELKELAIRVTDVVVEKLKNRNSRAQSIKLTKNQLVQQMKKMELRPYDNDILEAVVSAVNERLMFDEMMADIVREKEWDDLMDAI
jgi:hypothetical protein